MSDKSRRQLLRSLAVAPVVGALVSRAAAQSGVYGGFAPPRAKPSDAGTPAHFSTTCAQPPGAPVSSVTPEMLLEQGRKARERLRLKHFPDVTLVNQDGKKVRYYTDLLKDKVIVLNFFYAKCEGVCPGVNANLAKVYKLLGDRMGRQVFMYSISLKPEEDTPEVLKDYAHSLSAGPAWMFLTGNNDDIERVRRGMGFVNSDPVLDKDKSQHIGNICYGNEPLMLWGGGPGLVHATWLVKEISSVIAADVKRPAV